MRKNALMLDLVSSQSIIRGYVLYGEILACCRFKTCLVPTPKRDASDIEATSPYNRYAAST